MSGLDLIKEALPGLLRKLRNSQAVAQREKKFFSRANKECQTHRTMEGPSQGHAASHCWS